MLFWLRGGYNLKMLSKCPVCEATEIDTLPRYPRDYLVSCKRCSFVFSKRIPTRKELEDVYGRYDYLGADATIATLERKFKVAKSLVQLSGGGAPYWMLDVERESGLMHLSD